MSTPETILVRITNHGEASTVIAPNRIHSHKTSKRYPLIAEYRLVGTARVINTPCKKCQSFE